MRAPTIGGQNNSPRKPPKGKIPPEGNRFYPKRRRRKKGEKGIGETPHLKKWRKKKVKNFGKP